MKRAGVSARFFGMKAQPVGIVLVVSFSMEKGRDAACARRARSGKSSRNENSFLICGAAVSWVGWCCRTLSTMLGY